MNSIKDFTMDKYEQLCYTIIDANYRPVSVYEYTSGCSTPRVVILRHDVDRKIANALNMAELEHSLGICSTYYFRYPFTFEPEIIERISSMGHEIGYHYETLAKARGDYEEAISLFTQELEEFRNICNVRTICMHGSPLSRYDNRDLWKEYDLRNYGIEGEAYLTMSDKRLIYLSDTGRRWDGKRSMRDALQGSEIVRVRTTNELIDLINHAEEDIYLTAHPERWAIDRGEWIINYMKDVAVNAVKSIIAVTRYD